MEWINEMLAYDATPFELVVVFLLTYIAGAQGISLWRGR